MKRQKTKSKESPSEKTKTKKDVELKYDLYYTLLDQKSDVLPIPPKRMKELHAKLNKITNEQMAAIFLLVCEHAKLHDGFEYPTKKADDYNLPYDITNDDNKGCTIDISKLPTPLLHIIIRFLNIET